MEVLDSVLLVDQDKTSRDYHEKLIRNIELSRSIYTIENGREAFNFINTSYKKNRQLPSFIIADLSTLLTDNFDFIKQLENSDLLGVKRIPLAFLSPASNVERDLENLKRIYPFTSKPLDEIKLFHILHTTIIPLLSIQHQKAIMERQKFLEDQYAYLMVENAALKENINQIKKRRQELEQQFSRFKK